MGVGPAGGFFALAGGFAEDFAGDDVTGLVVERAGAVEGREGGGAREAAGLAAAFGGSFEALKSSQ